MKKNLLSEIKQLPIGEIKQRVTKARLALADLVLDKNMGKLKDLKLLYKKRKDIAQMLTTLRQKQLLGELESGVKKGNK